MKFTKAISTKVAFTASIVLSFFAHSSYAQPSVEEMWKLVQQQQQQIEALQKALTQQKQQIVETTVIATTAVEAVEAQDTFQSTKSWTDSVSIGGYGEHHLNIKEGRSDQIDAHRYVLYFNNQFTDELRFFSEFELEHSLAGEGKPGEVELEQAFIEWQYNKNHRANLGLYLVPAGILNETHEPDTFYGVERNKVESEVIPSTWWETGVMFSGEISPGLSYDAAVHSGLMVDNFRIRSGRQKSAEAIADDYAYTARLKYTGIAGLELSSTLQYQSDITQGTLSEDAAAVFFEAHAVYQRGDFGLRALYAGWDIDNTEFEDNGSDSPSGWYVEPSYKVTENLGVFARYSEIDPARGDRPTEKTELIDLGINYWLHPQVVLKADYQNSKAESSDSFNLGLGWSF